MKRAVLFVSHFINESYLKRYLKLNKDLKGQYDVYWLFQKDNGISDIPLHQMNINVEGFTIDDLNNLNYNPVYECFFGSEHFLDLYFTQRHPEYEYIWSIEYDVVFSGNWRVLFDSFNYNNADLLSSHIAHYCESNKNWLWWSSLSFNSKDLLPSKKWVKSYNPIHRYSRQALQFLDVYLQREGNSGFSEALVATILYNNGFVLEDFGGTGEFVSSGNHNRFYIQREGIHQGTMRWRPDYLLSDINKKSISNKLFHPVKE